MKIVLTDSQSLQGYDCHIEKNLFKDYDVEFIIAECKSDEEIIEKYSDADIILNVFMQITKKSIDALKNCKAIIKYGIGVDMIDVDAATKKGIMVCNVLDYCIDEVALHTIAFITSLSRQIMYYTLNIRKGNFTTNGLYEMHRPSKQVVGLIGFGRIARKVTKCLRAMDYDVVAYDPYLAEDIFNSEEVKKVSLDELFKISDIVSVHSPLTEETRYIIDKNSIEKMKDGVIIINVSRGPHVRESDLIDALNSKKVAAAALDVFETEPFINEDHPFYHMDNVLLSPHAAYTTEESFEEMCTRVAQSAARVVRGELPESVVNLKDLK